MLEQQLSLFGEPEPVAQTRKQTISTAVELLKNRPAPDPRSPVVVSYGAGINSTAMLVAMKLKGIRPDLILFADTGGEKPETYKYLKYFDSWLNEVGFPNIEVVRYEMASVRPRKQLLAYRSKHWKTLTLSRLDAWLTVYQNIRQELKYSTLEEECLVLKSLPAKAYGNGQCSQKWKVDPCHKRIASYLSNLGLYNVKVRQYVGIHAGEQQRLLQKDGSPKPLELENVRYEYPLIEWGLSQAHCNALIRSANLSVPSKSSCFFCPNMKASEVLRLKVEHPELYARGLEIEANAKEIQSKRIKGLGRSFAWKDIASATPLELAAWDYRQESRQCGCVD